MESDEIINRKKLSTRQILLIGIVLVILVVIIYLIFISQLNSHYLITKEVCHNETIERLSFPDDFEQLDVCPSFVNGTGVCFKSKYNDDVILKNGANYTTYKKVAIAGELPPVIKQVCELKEVDRIEYTNGEVYVHKKNIDESWLFEHCLGAVSCYGTFEQEDLSTCEFEENKQSQIYRCGEYYVETLK